MDSVAKGPVTRCLDNLSVRSDARENLAALRQRILELRDQSYRGLEGVFATYLFPGFYNAGQIEHIVNPQPNLVPMRRGVDAGAGA